MGWVYRYEFCYVDKITEAVKLNKEIIVKNSNLNAWKITQYILLTKNS